jgi:hypothetical protein
MKRLVPYLIVIVFGAGAANRALTVDAVVEPRTEAAVLAADDDWLAAEPRGDLNTFDARLMSTYRDVTGEGKVYTKQNLPTGAAKHPNKVTTPPPQAAADFRAQHPVVEHVLIEGDTAILQFESTKPKQQGVIRSVMWLCISMVVGADCIHHTTKWIEPIRRFWTDRVPVRWPAIASCAFLSASQKCDKRVRLDLFI